MEVDSTKSPSAGSSRLWDSFAFLAPIQITPLTLNPLNKSIYLWCSTTSSQSKADYSICNCCNIDSVSPLFSNSNSCRESLLENHHTDLFLPFLPETTSAVYTLYGQYPQTLCRHHCQESYHSDSVIRSVVSEQVPVPVIDIRVAMQGVQYTQYVVRLAFLNFVSCP